MSKKDCCPNKVHHHVIVDRERKIRCCESSKRRPKCPVPIQPPCELPESASLVSLYYTPNSTYHCEERPKTSKPHPRCRKIDIHISSNRSKKRSDRIPPVNPRQTCCSNNYYATLNKRPPAKVDSCTESTSSDDSCQDQRLIRNYNCRPERCPPPPLPPPIRRPICIPKNCCEKPVNLPKREKAVVEKECCIDGKKICFSIRPKCKSPPRNCKPVCRKPERQTKHCTVQTDFVPKSHKACQVYSRMKIATCDTIAQTERVSRAEKESQIERNRFDSEKKNQCLQTETEQDEEEQLDQDDDEYYGERSGPETGYESHTRSQGHAFPFVGESPSGNLLVPKHMVAFQSKNIGILVADPRKTRVWHKELQDCGDKAKGQIRRRDTPHHNNHKLPHCVKDHYTYPEKCRTKVTKQVWHYSRKGHNEDDRRTQQRQFYRKGQNDPDEAYYSPEEGESQEQFEDYLDNTRNENLKPNDLWKHQQRQYDDKKKQQNEKQYGPNQNNLKPVYSPEKMKRMEKYLDNGKNKLLHRTGVEESENTEMDMPAEKAKLNNLLVQDNNVVNPRSPPRLLEPHDFRAVKESELNLHDIPSTSTKASTDAFSSQQDPGEDGSGEDGEYLHPQQHENEIHAATTIQRHVRGYQARKQYKKIKHSAKVIQDFYRGHYARKQQQKQDPSDTGEHSKRTSGSGPGDNPPSEGQSEGQSAPHPTSESHSHVLTVGPYLREDLKVPREALLVLGGSDPKLPISLDPGTNSGKEIYMYSINAMTWTNVGALPEPRTHFGIAKIGYEVYIIGGTDPRFQTPQDRNVGVSTVWKFHLKTGEWYFDSSHPRHLDNPRSHFGCAAKAESIYIFGGNDEEARGLSSCQKYDTVFNTWTPISPMEGPRVSMGVAVYEDHIWLAGGITKIPENPVLKSVICYDTVTNSWTIPKSSLPLPRAFPTLAVAHGNLFLVGGAGPRHKTGKRQSSVPEILALHKPSGEWREVGTLNVARHGHASVAIDHRIVVLGGVSSEHLGSIDSVEIFDLSTSHSQKVHGLYENLTGMGAVSLYQQ